MSRLHGERNRTDRIGWLRAAVMGANDGIVSTASLVIGVAGAGTSGHDVVVAGVAGLVAGAMSMAAGEYVSVSSQTDTERSDLARESLELRTNDAGERAELTEIYVKRGLDPALAAQVTEQLMLHDALGAHARDELGLTSRTTARPVQAALASAAAFAVGAGVPLLAAWLTPTTGLVVAVGLASLACLAVLGGLAARIGGARWGAGSTRVTLWGAVAMAITFAVGKAFGAVV